MILGLQKTIKIIEIVSLILILSSCREGSKNTKTSNEVKDGYTFYDNGIGITATANGLKQSRNLSSLFDGKHSSVWSPFDSTCQADIKFVFSEPVYVKEIALLNGYPSEQGAFEAHNRVKSVSISTYKNEEDVSFKDSLSLTLKDTKNTQIISFAHSNFSSILRIKAMKIQITSCYEGTSKSVVGLRRVAFKFTDMPEFTPSLTVNEIKNRFGANFKKWSIKSSEDDDPIVYKVLGNLMWEGLHGNDVAERLFYSYSHQEAASGEMHSYLVSWYKLTKAVNKKKQGQLR